MTFALESRLAGGGFEVCRLDLSHVLLKDDARWPWLILVPARAGLIELHDLEKRDAAQLMSEISAASRTVAGLEGVQKVNVAALGNSVRQLHVHVVGRAEGDPGWPDPIWGVKGRVAFAEDAANALVAKLRLALLAG